MIITEFVDNGARTFTYSDAQLKIRQIETGVIYDTAIDVLPYHYEETDIPIETPAVEADE